MFLCVTLRDCLRSHSCQAKRFLGMCYDNGTAAAVTGFSLSGCCCFNSSSRSDVLSAEVSADLIDEIIKKVESVRDEAVAREDYKQAIVHKKNIEVGTTRRSIQSKTSLGIKQLAGRP